MIDTRAELITFIEALETATQSGALTVEVGTRRITYGSLQERHNALSRARRDLANWDRRLAGQKNPGIVTPMWS